jgi:hypothetical protein
LRADTLGETTDKVHIGTLGKTLLAAMKPDDPWARAQEMDLGELRQHRQFEQQ